MHPFLQDLGLKDVNHLAITDPCTQCRDNFIQILIFKYFRCGFIFSEGEICHWFRFFSKV